MNTENLQLNNTATEHGIRLVVLFGSQAVGKARNDSDYDLAVLLAEEKKFSELEVFNDVLFYLGKELTLPVEKIDLANISNANPLLQQEIFSKGQLLFGDRNLFDEYRAVAFREYIDAKKLFDLESAMLKKRVTLLKQLIHKNAQ